MSRPLDLQKLKIDRRPSGPRRPKGGRAPAAIAVVLVLGLGWLFRAPLLRVVDRYTLLEVQVVTAGTASASSVAAVAGTAANGYVVAAKRAALSADTPGRVVEMNVTEGTFVRAGDVVARLYSEEYEAALLRAQADVAAARAGLDGGRAEVDVAARDQERRIADEEAAAAVLASAQVDLDLFAKEHGRLRDLVGGGIEDERALDSAAADEDRARAAVRAQTAALGARTAAVREGEAQEERAAAAVVELEARLRGAEAAEAQARATLEKTIVRAPFDGIVVLKDAEVGEVVSPNSQGANSRGSVATLVDLDSLEVQIDLPETLLQQVEVGAPARIFLDAFPNEPYAGRVLRIWPTASRQKATVEIRVGFDRPDDRLRPDLGARVVFGAAELDPQGAAPTSAGQVLIPAAAVVRIDGEPGVFLLERDVVRWRPVQPGEERGGRVGIVTGLIGGERLVAEPPPELADGDRVRITTK